MVLLFLLALVLSSVSGYTVNYDGYSVLRMQRVNSTNYYDLYNFAEMYNLDIWATNKQENWMDIMIPPNEEILNVFKQYEYIVSIADVEEHIKAVENEQKESRKRQVFFDYFPNIEEVNEWLDTQHALHPTRTEIFVAGQTYQGRDIRGIRIFNPTGGQKQGVFIQGGIHAREWITVTSTLFTVQELLSFPQILNVFDFYIVPVFNVDGYIYSHNNDRMWRKNRQPATGSTCLGTDINRNYPFNWGRDGASANPCAETYRGASAGSTPEIQSITNFISNIPNGVAWFLDVHSYGSMFMSSWGFTYTLPPATDYNQMYDVMAVARSSIEEINGNIYAIGSSANVIYITSGASVDYAYATLGIIPSFTVEILGNSFRCSSLTNTPTW